MTCKDCIHFDVCFYYGEKAIRDNTPNAEIGCDNFKNKADYAEVVRCGNCKFAYKNRFLGEHYCEKTNTKIKQIHFCSLGKRK